MPNTAPRSAQVSQLLPRAEPATLSLSSLEVPLLARTHRCPAATAPGLVGFRQWASGGPQAGLRRHLVRRHLGGTLRLKARYAGLGELEVGEAAAADDALGQLGRGLRLDDESEVDD